MAMRSSNLLTLWLQLQSICMLYGTVNSPEHQRYQVNGIVGNSISLVLNLMEGKIGDKSYLDFQDRFGQLVCYNLAVFEDSQWKRSEHPDRFGQRLEMINETTVRITDLKMEDSGLYIVSVKLSSSEIQDHIFNLTVYAPVPRPEIYLHNDLHSSDKCNATLRCHVPGDGVHNISWIIGGTLNGSANGHQISGNTSMLKLLWDPTSSDINTTCVVSNPVDQKNASFDVHKTCPNEALRNKSKENKRIVIPGMFGILGFGIPGFRLQGFGILVFGTPLCVILCIMCYCRQQLIRSSGTERTS